MITLTETAIPFFQKLLNDNPNAIGIRVAVTTKGCGGYIHTLGFVDKIEPTDILIKDQDISLVVASCQTTILTGTVIDINQDGPNKEVTFTNPNTSKSCGCGKSFTVDI